MLHRFILTRLCCILICLTAVGCQTTPSYELSTPITSRGSIEKGKIFVIGNKWPTSMKMNFTIFGGELNKNIGLISHTIVSDIVVIKKPTGSIFDVILRDVRSKIEKRTLARLKQEDPQWFTNTVDEDGIYSLIKEHNHSPLLAQGQAYFNSDHKLVISSYYVPKAVKKGMDEAGADVSTIQEKFRSQIAYLEKYRKFKGKSFTLGDTFDFADFFIKNVEITKQGIEENWLALGRSVTITDLMLGGKCPLKLVDANKSFLTFRSQTCDLYRSGTAHWNGRTNRFDNRWSCRIHLEIFTKYGIFKTNETVCRMGNETEKKLLNVTLNDHSM